MSASVRSPHFPARIIHGAYRAVCVRTLSLALLRLPCGRRT